MSGVLAVFAHPDDESLLAGGTLAACAAAGARVAIVSMTRGEAGPMHLAAEAPEADLGTVRAFELRRAALALGVHEAECLGHPDGELMGVDMDAASAALARRMVRMGATTVITFGPEGLYWHPDHVWVHEVVHRAAALTPVPWVYEATMPEDLMPGLTRALASRGLPDDLWGLDPALFGVPRATISEVVDVRRHLSRKLDALRSHASQLAPDHALRAIPDDLAERFLGTEFFVRSQARGDGPAEDEIAALAGPDRVA